MPLTCEDVRQRKQRLFDGAVLDDSDFIEHVDHCENCQQDLDEFTSGNDWQQLSDALRAGGDYSASAIKSSRTPAAHLEAFVSYLAPTDDPHSLGRIGNMEVQGVIGHGGAGIVYKAHDTALGRNVAIKLLNPALANQESARNRFAREARAMASITHQHIVPVYAVAEHNEVPYFVMEYVPGGTLAERLENGPLDTVEAVRVGLQITRALAAAHRHGVVHRDVKPSNILLDPGVERVRVADFGLARAFNDQTHTETGTLVGTPQFMSPEQVRGAAVDGRSDLFSLGSVLFNCVTGRLPFEANSIFATMQQISNETAPSARQWNSDVPEWLDALIQQLHAHDPNQRINSSETLEQIFEQELSYLQQPDETRELPKRSWIIDEPKANRSMIRWGAVPVLLLVGALAWFKPLTQTQTEHEPEEVVLVAPSPPEDIKPELQTFVDRLTQTRVRGMPTHNMVAFSLGPEIMKALPPGDSLIVAQAAWPKLHDFQARRGLLKAFHFGRHPKILTVLNLGMTDQNQEVRETAEIYLRKFAMRSFAGNNAAYKAWFENNEKRPLKDVFRNGFRRLAGQLERVDLEVGLRILEENDIDLGGSNRKSSYPEAAQAVLESKLPDVVLRWCQSPSIASNQSSKLGGYLKQLSLNEQQLEQVIRPLLKSENTMFLKARAAGALARKHPNEARLVLEEWVAEFVRDRDPSDSLAEIGMRMVSWELAEIGDARSIPRLIAILDSDNSSEAAGVINDALTQFKLGEITRVENKSYLDGPWWRDWWEKNRQRLPESVRSMSILDLPKTAFGETYRSTSSEMSSHEGRMRLFHTKFEAFVKDPDASNGIWAMATEIADSGDVRAIPTLIGAIEADNSYDTVYGLGYFALGWGELGKITKVQYSRYHDGAWWRRWWEQNKKRFPKAAVIAIPDFPKTQHGKRYKPFPADLDTHEGRLKYLHTRLTDPETDLSDLAELFNEAGDPRGIPILIGLIASDESGAANYDVGYFGLSTGKLGKFTRVKYDRSMTALDWKAWWVTHREDFPTANEIDIPTFEIARPSRDPSSDVADVRNDEHQVGENSQQRYFLIGDQDSPPAEGFKLAIVLPGGDGGRGFNPFVRRIYKHTLDKSWLIAEPIAFKWTSKQEIVWPKQGDDVEGALFTTESFVDAVIADVQTKVKIDKRNIITLSWSSSGPAAYALALRPDSPITGSYIAMSVFKERFFESAEAAKDRRFIIDHSPEDHLCPYWMSEDAETLLKDNGGDVKRLTYKGGHGWRGDVYGRIEEGVEWLTR